MVVALAMTLKGYQDILLDLVSGRYVSNHDKQIALSEYYEKERPYTGSDENLFVKLINYQIATNDRAVGTYIKQIMKKNPWVISEVMVKKSNFKLTGLERTQFIKILIDRREYDQCLHLALSSHCTPEEREKLLGVAFESEKATSIFLKNGVYSQDDIQLLQSKALQLPKIAKLYYDTFRKETSTQIRERLFNVMLKSVDVAAHFISTKRNKATNEEKEKLFKTMLEIPKAMMWHFERSAPYLFETPERQKEFFNKHKDWLLKSYFRNDSTKLLTIFGEAIDEDAVKHMLKVLSRIRTNKLGLIDGILKAHDYGKVVLDQKTYDELNTIWTTEKLLNS